MNIQLFSHSAEPVLPAEAAPSTGEKRARASAPADVISKGPATPQSIVEKLPREIALHVWNWLSLADLARVIGVAKLCRSLTLERLEIGPELQRLAIETPADQEAVEQTARSQGWTPLELLNKLAPEIQELHLSRHIQEVDLSGVKKTWINICAQVVQFPRLTLLNLSGSVDTPREVVAELLLRCPKLISLNVRHLYSSRSEITNRLYECDPFSLSRTAPALLNLTELDCRDVYLCEEAMIAVLKNCTQITRLKLAWGFVYTSVLLPYLKNIKQITVIDPKKNRQVEDSNPDALRELIFAIDDLRSLSINRGDLLVYETYQFDDDLLMATVQRHRLEELIIYTTSARESISEKGVLAAAPHLGNLRKFHCPAVKFTDDGLRALVPCTPHLDTLYLQQDGLTDRCLEAISRYVHLTALGINGKRISAKGLRPLLESLPLQKLRLHSFSQEDLFQLTRSFGNLLSLRIHYTGCSDRIVKSLTKRCVNLVKLNINEAQGEGVEIPGGELSDTSSGWLVKLTNLKELKLVSNVSNGGMATLHRLRPDLNIEDCNQ